MPFHPERIYKDKGWRDWGKFLGTGRKKPMPFVSYEEAQRRVQEQGLKTSEEYSEWQKTQPDLPSHPGQRYKNKGWINWLKFLGKKNKFSGTNRSKAKIFVSYEEAKKRVQTKGIKSIKDYGQWQKAHKDIPSNPNLTYKGKGWTKWGDFLGTGQTRSKTFVSYEEAQARVQKAKIKRAKEYWGWQKTQEGMPRQSLSHL